MNPPTKVAYQWKELLDLGAGPVYVSPWVDSMLHEQPFDFLWDTPEDAMQGLTTFRVKPEVSDAWVLVQSTYEPFPRPPVKPKSI